MNGLIVRIPSYQERLANRRISHRNCLRRLVLYAHVFIGIIIIIIIVNRNNLATLLQREFEVREMRERNKQALKCLSECVRDNPDLVPAVNFLVGQVRVH